MIIISEILIYKTKNRLHGLLFNQYGQTLSIFSSLFSKVSFAFFAKYSGPSMLEGIYPDSPADFLKVNSKGRYSEKAIFIKLKITEELAQIKDMFFLLAEKSSYGSITSIPGVDVITAAKIISSVVDIGRFSSSAKLAKFAGIAPREKST